MNTSHPLDVALAACINGRPEVSEKILREYPDKNDLRVIFNLGWHEMRHGNLKKGLQMMDAGRFISVFGMERIPGEIWRDQDLTNKTLLFRSENGYGDEIINFRFAKDFKNKGARVVISCSSSLRSLFSKHGFVCVDHSAATNVYYDYWVPAMSAAHILGYDSHNFPGKPYMQAPAKNLYGDAGSLKIGIRWAGNPQFEHEQHRKFDPKPLIDLYKIPGVTLYSLQRDEDLVDGLPFADLRDQLKTWEDTASIVQGLDLVITSCTSIAHLAGALGKETWVIVPIMPYYVWSVPGDKSVWYDTVRIFRQERYGNWEAPLNSVKDALLKKLEQQKRLKAA